MSSAKIICPLCGFENDPTASLCVRCQAVLRADTRTMDPPPELEVTFKGGSRHLDKKLYLHLVGSSDFIELDLEDGGQYVLGRFDTSTNTAPAIDLSSFRAVEKGVSRNHAFLTYENGSLKLADLSSANFTYLNNQKLIPRQARLVRDGDEIRLGHLVMIVQFGDRE